MSSWKKASKSNQKVHRERAQPAAREHLGALEKKKDYKQRANDQHQKDATLKALRKRALNKNPDEFYHHMINSKIQKGEHHELEQGDEFTMDQIKLMQTQDLKYVTMKRTMEANKIRRLQSQLHMTDIVNGTPNNHIFFVDNDEEATNFNLAARLDTHPELIGRRTNRPRLKDLAKLKPDRSEPEVLERIARERDLSYNELKRRIEREKELAVVQKTLEIKRTLKQKRKAQPKRVKKGTADGAPVYQFQYERKR
ncbi:probable U3 small nucleolar RNA-associated protein 11 [Anopheles bellator]|uniref:probable U3 small nucleolar RNA-associated protein 11 n=1 Tax=Anopheles bellator TaxID=139047 RepID=UPI00264A30A5|nr:probable U3 small nucleolar RNA-associated protein 11 [Anopheles bellator]